MNVAWANLVIVAEDVNVPERGLDLNFSRTYNSQSLHDCTNDDASTQGLYGAGWTNSFDEHAAFYNNGTILSIYDADGARYDYTANGSGGWTPPPGMQGTTISAATDGYLWTNKSGEIYYFKSPDYGTLYGSQYAGWDGRLRAIYGRNANNTIALNYTWDNNDASTAAHISNIAVAHSDGQSLNLAFADVNGCRVLTTLTRPDGQTVNYHYSGGQLSEVDRPGNGLATTTSPVANQLPESYSYSGGSAPRIVIYGPRILLSSWASGGNPQDGSAVFVDLNSLNQVTDTFDDGNVNFEPSDGTNTYLQPTEPVNRKVWRTATYSYDSGVTGLIDTDGHQTQWYLDGSGRETLRQDLNGSVWLGSTRKWDPNDDLIEETDFRGNATDYAYDSNGNLIAQALPSVATSAGTFRPTSLYSYDAFNNVIAFCDATYSNAHSLNWGATTPGVSECPRAVGTTQSWYVYPTYEPYGELSAMFSPMNYETQWSYSPAQQGGTDYGLATSMTGAAVTQANGVQTSVGWQQQYDGFGNLACWTTPGKSSVGWSEATYDSLGRRLTEGDADDSAVTSPACTASKTPGIAHSTIVTDRFYNPDGSIASSQTPEERAGTVVTANTYDADGNLIAQTSHHNCLASPAAPSPAPAPTSTCSPGITQSWYDGFDRLVEVAKPSNSTYDSPWITRYLYDVSNGQTVSAGGSAAFRAYGNLFDKQTRNSTWIDASATSFDGLDRPLSEYDFGIGTTPVQTYSYDTSPNTGLLSTLTDGVGNVRSFSYDADAHVTSESFTGPDASRTPSKSYSYEPDGRQATISASFGQEKIGYDLDGHLVSRTEPSGLYVQPFTFTYHYLLNGLRASVDVSSSTASQSGLYSYLYDSSGQPASTSVTFGSKRTFTYAYTLGGRPLSVTDPTFGQTYTYTLGTGSFTSKVYSYDSYGRISALLIPGQQAPGYSPIGYDAEGDTKYLGGYGPVWKTGDIPVSTASSILVNDYDASGALARQNLYTGNPAFAFTDIYSPQYVGGVATSGDPIDGRGLGASLSYGKGSSVVQCSGPQTYDKAGRQVGAVETCHSYVNGVETQLPAITVSRTFDAHNRIVNSVSSAPAIEYDYQGRVATNAPAYAQGSPTLNVSITSSAHLHWDNDSLSFITNAAGAIQAVLLNTDAAFYSDGSYVVNDKSPDDLIEAQHGWSASGGTLDVGWLPDAPVVQNSQKATTYYFGRAQYISSVSSSLPAPYIGTRSDGYEFIGTQGNGSLATDFVVQGTRDYSPDAGSFMSRDAYKGELNDPASGLSYLWNRNNPLTFSDPSGYCTSKKQIDPDCADATAHCGCSDHAFWNDLRGAFADFIGPGPLRLEKFVRSARTKTDLYHMLAKSQRARDVANLYGKRFPFTGGDGRQATLIQKAMQFSVPVRDLSGGAPNGPYTKIVTGIVEYIVDDETGNVTHAVFVENATVTGRIMGVSR